MAEDEDGNLDKKSSQNSNNGGQSHENESNASRPDLGIEEAKYNSNDNGESSPRETKCSTSKSGGGMRKEENPFSFRHFLKRDLSLPGTSTYESTGARPKVYSSTVQPSPTREERRERRTPDHVERRTPDHLAQAKEINSDCSVPIVDNASSSSSVEMPFTVVENSDSKHNFYAETSEVPYYHRPNLASEPLGMPSLPDFVQDHILVEQAYLNPNGPISVDLDNLPDFTFNTNFNEGSSSSLGRRNNTAYGAGRDYDYDSYMGASVSNDSRPDVRDVQLDLPGGAEGSGIVPLDLPAHLSLDLTESVNPSDRRNMSPRNTFPLDLPPNAGAESMRLPDFLPVHPGRTSPEPEHQDEQLQQIMSELECIRAELFAERSRRCRLEEQLSSMHSEAALLRGEVGAARSAEAAARAAAGAARAAEEAARAALHEARRRDREYTGQLDEAAARVETYMHDSTTRATDADATIAKLRYQVKKLKEEAAESQQQLRALRSLQGTAATDLRRATSVAELSLRDLLAGLEQLKSLSNTLDPT